MVLQRAARGARRGQSPEKSSARATFVQYANDNPFSAAAKPGLWRHYLTNIPLFDVHLSYRMNNIADYRRHGAISVHLLRSYFIPEEDYPVSQAEIPDRFRCDVVFAGHYEDEVGWRCWRPFARRVTI